MCRFYFLTFLYVLSLPLLNSPVLGSTLMEESDAPKTFSSLRVTVLGRATCQSLENRVLMMVKIEN